MNPLEHSNNIAARMGRWSASHKKTAIFGWLAFIVVAFAIGQVIGTKQLDQNKTGSGESGHVDSILRDEFEQAQGDQILIQSTTKTVDDSGLPGGGHRCRSDGWRYDAGEEGRVAVRAPATWSGSPATATRPSSRSSFARLMRSRRRSSTSLSKRRSSPPTRGILGSRSRSSASISRRSWIRRSRATSPRPECSRCRSR